MRIFLLGCVKTKRPAGTHPARDLYTSPLFTLSRRWIEARLQPGDRVLILSAHYGAVEWTEPLATYEQSLSALSKTERGRWRQGVEVAVVKEAWAARQDGRAPDYSRPIELVILAGAQYRAGWLPGLLERFGGSPGIIATVPLAGLGFGKQLQRLSQELKGTEAHAS